MQSEQDAARRQLDAALHARDEAAMSADYLGSGHAYRRHAEACAAVRQARWALAEVQVHVFLAGMLLAALEPAHEKASGGDGR